MILVSYLVAPGETYGEAAVRFVESYARHPAGLPHDLLIVQKEGSLFLPGTCEGFDQADHLTFTEHPNAGYDIGSLQRVCAGNAEYDYVCWLGSWSRLLSDNWLRKLCTVARRPGIGAVSATGSREAGISYQFPNPHLRTNGLVIAPKLLNSLGFGPCYSRTDCYEFEHGSDSLYRRIQARGLSAVVVGAEGFVYYTEEDWGHSRTYRHGEQENLLVADKQTDSYLSAGPDERMALAQAAGWAP